MGVLEQGAGFAAGLGAIYALRKWRESQWETELSKRRIDGQVVVITGGSAGLGKATAKDLASRGAIVVLACRDIEAAKEVVKEIKKEIPSAQMDIIHLDLASLESVRRCAQLLLERYPQLNILVNNAGVSVPATLKLKTVEGHEINFGVNHLGHFLFTHLLIDRLRESAPSRVVIVSSGLHERGVMDWEVLEGTKELIEDGRSRGPNAGYCNSKLANVLFGIRLSEKLAGQGVTVYSVCPGWNYTKLFRYSSVPFYSWIAIAPVAFWFMRPARIGAQTIIHCAVSEDVKDETGLFYRDCKVFKSKANLSADAAGRLWELSCKLCQIEW